MSRSYRRALGKALHNLLDVDFHGLDPRTGSGYVELDLREAVPPFLLSGLSAFNWPKKGVWAFDGDPLVSHYIDYAASSAELASILGVRRVRQLQAFSTAVVKCIAAHLPTEERKRLDAQRRQLVLDLAELRISDGQQTVGGDVHIDWYPREGMVLIIPLQGSRTKIFAPRVPLTGCHPGEGVLITAFDRWATFHSFDSGAREELCPVKTGQTHLMVPRGVLGYLQSRGRVIADDLHPQWPGVLPIVHQAGHGARMNLVLNFAYQSRSGEA